MEKKILLIFPQHLWYWSASPPGVGYIASALEGIGWKVKFFDCRITPRYKKIILSLLPDYPVVGLSVNAGNVSSALDLAKAIKKISPRTKIIMGGPHATVVYEKLIPEYADIVVRGEGEDTMVELMQNEDLASIKGIAYWDNGLKVTPSRPYIEDLDRLRFPAWHLYDLKKYRFSTCRTPLALVITSRGCPYDCFYCTKFIHGYKLRLRSIDNIMAEIDYLVKNFQVKEVYFADDNVTFYPERVKELCQAIISRKYKDVYFSVLADPNFGNYELFKLMKQANFNSISISIESGSQEILSTIPGRKKIDFAELKERIKIANQVGIRLRGHFVIGLPFDTLDSMKKTIDFAKNSELGSSDYNIAIPFPGTKFYKIVEEKGKFLYDLTLNSISYDLKPVYETDSLKAKDVERMFRQAYREFYFRPKQIRSMITSFTRISQPRTTISFFREGFRLLVSFSKPWQ